MTALSSNQRWLALSAVAVFATLLAFIFMAGPFRYSSVCDKCGAFRHVTEWQFPFTDFTLFASSMETNSALSRALTTNSIVTVHAHHWLFSNGGGNGVRCAIGPGRHIWPAAESVDFVEVVLALHRHQQIAFRDRAVAGVFNPNTSQLFRRLLSRSATTMMSSAEMQAWITEQFEYLDELLEIAKPR